MVSPLLCGVGFRLLPALISASSSELSPVGDIMLKDLVPTRRQERRCWLGLGLASLRPHICPSAAPFPNQEGRGPWEAPADPQREVPAPSSGGPTILPALLTGHGGPAWRPPGVHAGSWTAPGTPVNVSAQDTD